jgi:hypothetical protein
MYSRAASLTPVTPKSANDCYFLFGFSLHLQVTGSAITKVAAVVHRELERVALAADVAPSPVVHAHSVLTAAAGQLEPITARVEVDVLAANRYRLRTRPAGGDNFTPVQAGRDVSRL